MIPGEVTGDGPPITLNPGRPVISLRVSNTGDRPVQVGSHFHFAEVNAALTFDRDAAHGRRLAIPAGTSVRFEPGADRQVDLVPFGGARVAAGFRGLVAGPLGPVRVPPTPEDPGGATGGADG